MASGLPVKLGLAILRDRRGVIAFDLPIEGSLDDPDIKYGKLVWKAVFGLLGKIATSPFTLLGKLFGGDAGDLSSLAFAPGSSSLEAVATPKLQALAKALQERPELRLDAEGGVDADQDGAALRKAALEALLRRTRTAALKTAEDQPVPAAERERWIRAAHEAARDGRGGGATRERPVAPGAQLVLVAFVQANLDLPAVAASERGAGEQRIDPRGYGVVAVERAAACV